jgi:DNA-binding HxlR family transcriptional regulator
MTDFRSPCPIASALDLIGDRWTLVVVRDAVTGKRRFGEFAASPERIPTNILADRLRRLERDGILARRLYQARPRRYEYVLTERGAELLPILQALGRWGGKHIPQRWTPPAWFAEATPASVLGRLSVMRQG